ncbi:GPI ethanolamine phosphate transferase 3 [Ischnura elegans]|uniref:GPI ethanolamine phosphate transferase 3 n=1 Tax=Ischnura elegans TaxID=197161 RepID=UPI001ED89067|nr:GPI ethanolamine phosphate transferase 3 [Ischnura elegans]
MARAWKYILVTLWLYFFIFSCVYLFSRGFLLKRDVFTNRTQCLPWEDSGEDGTLHSGKPISSSNVKNGTVRKGGSLTENLSTCLPTRYKVVLIVVDALRYDFIQFNESLNDSDANAFQNKIPIIHETLLNQPWNSRMYKFVADPPTTTMQRLKGITTGSLPTFIDVGSNFATPEINEDNIIDQLVSRNLSVIFMGDDTWTGLYPKRFLREFPYPSFNVWDLDTVDNGIMHHLLPEVKKKDWKLLIGHFLGVDHCGHKYGPYHPEMTRKLKEVNTTIRQLLDVIDEDTVLLVIGDHGMTSTGDHGGDSMDEVMSALFVYSRSTLFPLDTLDKVVSVSQIDLVPTLSFILGVPIPFANLGNIIIETLPMTNNGNSDVDWKYALAALWSNALQVNNYLMYYSNESRQFSEEKLQIILKKFDTLSQQVDDVSNLEEFKMFHKQITEYFTLARNLCSEVWVQFDEVLMLSGLIFMFTFIFSSLFILEGAQIDKIEQFINSSYMFFGIVFGISLCASYGLKHFHFVSNLDVTYCFFICFLSLICILVINMKVSVSQVLAKLKAKDNSTLAARIIFLTSVAGFFSNSYVVEDSTILSFYLVSLSLICLYFSSNIKDLTKQRSDKNRLLYKGTPIKPRVILLTFLFGFMIRLSHYYWRCREEQKWCVNSEWLKFSASMLFSVHGLQFLYTLVYLALLVTVFRMWLRSSGNLVGFSFTVSIVRYVPTVIVICISAFWILQGLPKNTKYSLKPWQIQIWPSVIFFLMGISIFRLYINPLSVYMLPRTKVTMDGVYGQENIIPHLFNQLKESLDRRNREKAANSSKYFPVVYGLATVYSAAVIIFGLFILLFISLLLGDILAPSTAVMLTASILLLAVQAVYQHERIMMPSQLFNVPWSSILCWALLSSYFFYATGHQPTFSSIQWDAAFVGTGGQVGSHIVPAVFILMNTFASQFWFALILPLLIISPFTLVVMFPNFIKKDGLRGEMKRGELVLYEKESQFHHGVFILCSKYVLFHALRVVSCMAAAALHRRHLMVWKIFAPKFIFEGISLLITMLGVFLGYTLVLRVTKVLKVMMKKLE